MAYLFLARGALDAFSSHYYYRARSRSLVERFSGMVGGYSQDGLESTILSGINSNLVQSSVRSDESDATTCSSVNAAPYWSSGWILAGKL